MRRGRRRGRFLALALVLVAALAAVLPTAAVAAEVEEDEGFAGAFVIHASRGYRIFGIAFARPNAKRGELTLFVARKNAAAIYFTPATVTAASVKADLGPVGSVDFSLALSGRKKRVHPSCDKKQTVTYEPGFFEGRFEFHGEEGFTDASVTKTPFLIQPLLDLGCGIVGVGETWGSADLPGARLRVKSRRGSERLEVQFNKNGPRKATHFEASLDEKRGGLQIHRSVGGFTNVGAFEFAPDVTRARVKAPPPFSGLALFSRGAAPVNRWTGNLAVDFPGRSGVRVAGPGARATLDHALRSRETIHFDRLARPGGERWQKVFG
jgi:hypothetical protein